jgi:hypothetical protein
MRQLHYLPVPEDQENSQAQRQLRQQLASAGLLGTDRQTVERTASDAPDETIQAEFRYPLVPNDDSLRAEMLAAELRELAPSAKGPVALFRRGSEPLPEAGYYNVDRASADPASPGDRRAWTARAELTRAGTRKSHWRAVRTTVRDVDHPFGTATTKRIGVPTDAVRTRWLHPTDHTYERATSSTTLSTAFGDVARYEVSQPTNATSEPTLIYDVPYSSDIPGPRVYDTRGNGNKTDGDDIRQWQAVHETQHDIEDEIVFSSGKIRWRITQPDASETGTDTVEEWSSGSWSQTSLTSSDFAPYDVDVIENTLQRVRAQVTFIDTNTLSSQRFYTLEVAMELGDSNLHLFRPESQGTSVPSSLDSRYDAVAASTEKDVSTTRTLVSREVTRG